MLQQHLQFEAIVEIIIDDLSDSYERLLELYMTLAEDDNLDHTPATLEPYWLAVFQNWPAEERLDRLIAFLDPTVDRHRRYIQLVIQLCTVLLDLLLDVNNLMHARGLTYKLPAHATWITYVPTAAR